MITVTNGTVERVYKPGDYESRRVSLSFNCDPGDDLDIGLANLSTLAEKHARQLPGNLVPGKKRLTGDEIVGDVHPPTARTEAAPSLASVSGQRADPPTLPSAATTPAEPAQTGADTALPAAPATLEALVEAARAAVARVGVERRGEVVAINNQFLDEPNAPLRTMAEDKRAAAIAALAKVGKPSEY